MPKVEVGRSTPPPEANGRRSLNMSLSRQGSGQRLVHAASYGPQGGFADHNHFRPEQGAGMPMVEHVSQAGTNSSLVAENPGYYAGQAAGISMTGLAATSSPALGMPNAKPFSLGQSRPASGQSKTQATLDDKRATLNATERARRDSLNSHFQDIAECIPNLRGIQRPSKSLVMQRTLEYVKSAQRRFEQQRREIMRLRRENQRLREVVSSLRGIPLEQPAEPGYDASDTEDAGEPLDAFFEAATTTKSASPPALAQAAPTSSTAIASSKNKGWTPAVTETASSQAELQTFEAERAGPSTVFDDSSVDLSMYLQQPMDDESLMPSSMADLQHTQSFTSELLVTDLRRPHASLQNEYSHELPSEVSDTFDFDLMKERVELGLSERHDKGWLMSHNIIKETTAAPLQATTQQIEFKIKQRSIGGKLSIRPTVDDLIDMHILEAE